MAIIVGLRLLLLAMWLGAALFFSAVVAPTVFSALRAHHLSNVGEVAGTIVSRTLSVVNVSGFVISVILLATIFAFRRGYAPRSFALELLSLITLTVSTALGQWVIAARMRALRAAMVLPIDQLPTENPARVDFNNLHGYSVIALSVAMIAALIAFGVIVYRARLEAS